MNSEDNNIPPVDNSVNEQVNSLSNDVLPQEDSADTDGQPSDTLKREVLEGEAQEIEARPIKPDSIWTKVKRYTAENKAIAITIGIIVLIILLILCDFIFHYDKLFLKSTLKGQVLGSSDKALQGVNMKIDNNSVTVSSGNFNVSSLTYGNHKIYIKANGYKDYTSTVNLKIGENDINFQMVQLTYANLSGSVSSVSGDTHIANLEIDLGSYKVNTDSQGNFSFNKIPTGDYTLNVNSPFYQTVNQNIVVNPGTQKLNTISLQPGAEAKGSLKDWLTGKALPNINIVVNKNSYTTDSNGNYDIKGLPVGSTTFSIQASNYNNLSQNETLSQGMNNLSDILFVPQGLIAYASSSQGNDNIYVSNYDGGNAVQITDNATSYVDPTMSSDGSTIYYYKVVSNGNVQLIAYNIANKSSAILISAMNVQGGFNPYLSVDIKGKQYLNNQYKADSSGNNITYTLYNIQGSNQTQLATSPTGFNGYLYSTDKTKVYYATTSNIYSVNTDGSNNDNVFSLPAGYANLSILGQGGNNLYFYYNDSGYTRTYIGKIDMTSTQNPQANAFPAIPYDVGNFGILTSDSAAIYYMHNSNGINNLYSISLSDGSIKQITNSINVQSSGTIGGLQSFVGQSSSGGAYNLYIISNGGNTAKSVEADPSANFSLVLGT